jgi:hypothetical protein
MENKYHVKIQYIVKCIYCDCFIYRKPIYYNNGKLTFMNFDTNGNLHPCQIGKIKKTTRCIKCEINIFGSEQDGIGGVLKSNIEGVKKHYIECIRYLEHGYVIYDNCICNH